MKWKWCSNNEILFQIMKFTHRLNMGFYLQILKIGHHLFTCLYVTFHCRPGICILSWLLLMSTSVQFSQNDVIVYGVNTAQILCLSKCFQGIFYDNFQWNYNKMPQPLTFAGSLGSCLITRPQAECSNSFLWTWQILMVEAICTRVLPIRILNRVTIVLIRILIHTTGMWP